MGVWNKKEKHTYNIIQIPLNLSKITILFTLVSGRFHDPHNKLRNLLESTNNSKKKSNKLILKQNQEQKNIINHDCDEITRTRGGPDKGKYNF